MQEHLRAHIRINTNMISVVALETLNSDNVKQSSVMENVLKFQVNFLFVKNETILVQTGEVSELQIL